MDAISDQGLLLEISVSGTGVLTVLPERAGGIDLTGLVGRCSQLSTDKLAAL